MKDPVSLWGWFNPLETFWRSTETKELTVYNSFICTSVRTFLGNSYPLSSRYFTCDAPSPKGKNSLHFRTMMDRLFGQKIHLIFIVGTQVEWHDILLKRDHQWIRVNSNVLMEERWELKINWLQCLIMIMRIGLWKNKDNTYSVLL